LQVTPESSLVNSSANELIFSAKEQNIVAVIMMMAMLSLIEILIPSGRQESCDPEGTRNLRIVI
jgi:hypothetical protein